MDSIVSTFLKLKLKKVCVQLMAKEFVEGKVKQNLS